MAEPCSRAHGGRHSCVCSSTAPGQQEGQVSSEGTRGVTPSKPCPLPGDVDAADEVVFCKDTAAFQKVANAFAELLSYTFQTPKLHKSPEKMQVSQREILEPLQTFCQ